jgi:hypothetical protein
MKKVRWQAEPYDHDFPAAVSYLGLIADPDTVAKLVTSLKKAPIQHARAKAKDILRASGLPDLPRDNVDVAQDVAKVKAGMALSPVLFVRGDIERGVPLQIADGYHRVCASYHLGEDIDIPCRIVGLA